MLHRRRQRRTSWRELWRKDVKGDNKRLIALTETAMSCSLPSDLFDLIVDHLRDEPTALKSCCLVSKSWVPRTRRHLFARVKFGRPGPWLNLVCLRRLPGHDIESWMKTFPDPSNSPAHHTRSLRFSNLASITAASAHAGTYVHPFHHVVELKVKTRWPDSLRTSLAQFKRFSPSLRSLCLSRISTTLSEVLDLICSFPLLEDVRLDGVVAESGTDQWHAPLTSPKLTGLLHLNDKNHLVARRLLDLPDGLHFSEILVVCPNESIAELVLRCSDTLESFTILYDPSGMFPSTSGFSNTSLLTVGIDASRALPLFDLSKATKLKEVRFHCHCGKQDIRWNVATLQTAKPNNLQKIALYLLLVSLSLARALFRSLLLLLLLLFLFRPIDLHDA